MPIALQKWVRAGSLENMCVQEVLNNWYLPVVLQKCMDSRQSGDLPLSVGWRVCVYVIRFPLSTA